MLTPCASFPPAAPARGAAPAAAADTSGAVVPCVERDELSVVDGSEVEHRRRKTVLTRYVATMLGWDRVVPSRLSRLGAGRVGLEEGLPGVLDMLAKLGVLC